MYVGIAYHHKLKDIESAALRCTDHDRVRVACHLGSIASLDPTKVSRVSEVSEAMLRVELADALIRDAKLHQNQHDELIRSFKDIVEAWRSHPNEEIRMRGLRMRKL